MWLNDIWHRKLSDIEYVAQHLDFTRWALRLGGGDLYIFLLDKFSESGVKNNERNVNEIKEHLRKILWSKTNNGTNWGWRLKEWQSGERKTQDR